MSDLISRQAAIDAVHKEFDDCIVWDESGMTTADEVERILDGVPSAQPEINQWCTDCKEYDKEKHHCPRYNRVIREALKDAEAKQYTKEELKIFLHGLSLRLLSLRSAQHWQEDEETAKEIVFLAHLYEKVEADMKGKT